MEAETEDHESTKGGAQDRSANSRKVQGTNGISSRDANEVEYLGTVLRGFSIKRRFMQVFAFQIRLTKTS